MLFLATQVSITAGAAQVLLMNICTACYMIPYGFQIAGSILVGGAIGA
jgi:Na+-driven multidrug efflux pump